MHPLTVTRKELLSSSGTDVDFREFIIDMMGLMTKVEVIRAGFGKMVGLTGVEYTMLVAIAHREQSGPVYVNSLAEHLHLSGAFVTLQTNKMERKGLIEKVKDSKDARRVMLQTTDQAEEILEELASKQCQVNDMLYESLSKKDFEKFAATIRQLLSDSERAVALLNYMNSEKS